MEDKPTKVLLIEDSLFATRQTQKMLTQAKSNHFDVELECADRLKSGLARLASGGIDAVLLDLGLPDSQDLDTFVKVYAQAPKVPIVVLTGLEDEIIATEAVNKGAQDYLVKGQVDSNLLKRSILYAIERKRLSKIKDEFINTVSHELRTPLSMVKEAITLILDRVPGEINEQQNKILTISKNNIDRLARLINDLLDMSKIEAGKVELRKSRVNVLNTIKAAVSAFESKAKKKGLKLRIRCSGKVGDIYVDEDRIIQLLTILIDNAIKFTSQGFIEISAQEKEDVVEYSVADTGVEIPKENLNKVFEKFTQFGRKDGPGNKGTGLGLSIAKGIVELHKGKIWAESEVERGTRFTFSLPKLGLEEIFKQYFSEATKEAKGKESYFSVIIVSILNFKELIRLSCEKAKEIIKKIEEVIKNFVRTSDILVSEGKVILLILPETKKNDAILVQRRTKNKLRRYLSTQKHFKGKINIDTEVISFPDEAREEDILIKIKMAKNG